MKNKSILELQQDRRIAEKPFLVKTDAARPGSTSHSTLARTVSRPVANVELVAWRWRIIVLLRVLMGCFCVGDAWLKWHTNFESAYLSLLTHAASSQTPVTSIWFDSWLHIAQLNAHAFVAIVMLLEICLGVGLICGAMTRLTCGGGIFLTLLGGMGTGLLNGFFGQGSFDVGVMVVFLLVFVGLLLSNAGQYLSLDRWLRPGR
ncbi:hypothetical protein KDW_49910 [Dictyobacter vulcani]|uniref:TQO small subunit DoxD domain-containing protein n=1 Tax=Dictyobacter vulcani TaxID=2607529 RepID=A0A5J4KXI4_9CHLR|nr:DoxX family membrane protein [Dictyobacter vulcani]GER90829.1 hypothetical protein KDW_49910 [Dictyobacter vulcani]